MISETTRIRNVSAPEKIPTQALPKTLAAWAPGESRSQCIRHRVESQNGADRVIDVSLLQIQEQPRTPAPLIPLVGQFDIARGEQCSLQKRADERDSNRQTYIEDEKAQGSPPGGIVRTGRGCMERVGLSRACITVPGATAEGIAAVGRRQRPARRSSGPRPARCRLPTSRSAAGPRHAVRSQKGWRGRRQR